jgi:hypothetical protein
MNLFLVLNYGLGTKRYILLQTVEFLEDSV